MRLLGIVATSLLLTTCTEAIHEEQAVSKDAACSFMGIPCPPPECQQHYGKGNGAWAECMGVGPIVQENPYGP